MNVSGAWLARPETQAVCAALTGGGHRVHHIDRDVSEGVTGRDVRDQRRAALGGQSGKGGGDAAHAALPVSGSVTRTPPTARVGYLPQEPEFPAGATVASELEVARAPLREAIDSHARLSGAVASEADPERRDRMLAELAALVLVSGA